MTKSIGLQCNDNFRYLEPIANDFRVWRFLAICGKAQEVIKNLPSQTVSTRISFFNSLSAKYLDHDEDLLIEIYLKSFEDQNYQHLIINNLQESIIDRKDSEGKTLLHSASFQGNSYSVPFFIERGANINLKDDDNGDTPLHLACREGNVEIIDVLLQNGAKTEITNNNGQTPLLMCYLTDNIKAAEALLQNGADVNFQMDGGNSVLHIACENKHSDWIEMFTKYGANFDLQDKDGVTPRDLQ